MPAIGEVYPCLRNVIGNEIGKLSTIQTPDVLAQLMPADRRWQIAKMT